MMDELEAQVSRDTRELAERWEGSPTFPSFVRWAGVAAAVPERAGTWVGAEIGEALERARPLVVEQRQVEVLPSPSEGMARAPLAFLAEADLPFAAVVVDLVDARGQGLQLAEVGLTLKAISAWSRAGALHLAPLLGDEAISFVPGVLSLSRTELPEPVVRAERARARWERVGVDHGAPLVRAGLWGRGEPREAPYDGYCTLTFEPEAYQDPDFHEGSLRALGLAGDVLGRILYLLDAANAEVGEIEASRQVRRRAARLGRELAAAIEIKRPRQRRARASDHAGESRYSHRFEVIGHYAHYGPGTWLFEHSAAEKRGRCPRCGSCRRVWRGPHVRGPAERPLVLKTRFIAGQAVAACAQGDGADAPRGRLARLVGRIRAGGG